MQVSGVTNGAELSAPFCLSGFELGEWRPSTLTFAARRFRCQASPSACLPLRPVTVVRQLLDVVHHAVELPLRIDFPASAQREAIEPFVVPEVAEHRFDRGEALPVEFSSTVGVDGPFRPVGGALLRSGLALKDAHLPGLGLGLGLVRRSETFLP